jgi:hypothetical protein
MFFLKNDIDLWKTFLLNYVKFLNIKFDYKNQFKITKRFHLKNTLKLGVRGLPFVSNSSNGQVSNFALFPQVFQAAGHPSNINATFRGNNFPYPRQRSIKFRKPANPEVTLTFAFYTVRGPQGIVFFRTSTVPINVSEVLFFYILPCEN